MTGKPITPLEWTDELVTSIWEYYAERPETYFTYQFGDRILEETLKYIPDGATVCDFGCGAGFLLSRLLETYRVVGIDFVQSNLDKAQARIGAHTNLIGLHRSQAEVPNLRVDAVYFVETVEHLLPSQVAPTFAALRNLLRPGGVVVCTTPHDENLSDQEVFCPVTRKTFHRYQHMRSFTSESLSSLFSEYGFHEMRGFTTDFAARTLKTRLKAKLRPMLGRKNPHLVYVGRLPAT